MFAILDNIEIANGSLQRRYLLVDILCSLINTEKIKTIISLAGGSCVVPIEAIFQTEDNSLLLINIDISDKALSRSNLVLANANSQKTGKKVNLSTYKMELTSGGFELPDFGNCPKIIECTELWEYLNTENRNQLLKSVYNGLNNYDSYFILTVLVNNPDENFFHSLGFKNLYPCSIKEVIAFVESSFSIENIVFTPNRTYAIFILKRKESN